MLNLNSFPMFNKGNQPQAQPLTPKQERLMEQVDKYKKGLPPFISLALNSLLPTLGDSMTDEKIDYFVQHTRQLLHYIESGEDLPFTDTEGADPEYVES